MTPIEFNSFLHREIPLTRDMDIQVQCCDNQQLILTAPLKGNHNDKGTGFGGSLYSIAVLSGWGLIYLWLLEKDISADVMIYDSQIKFVKPVTSDFICCSQFQNDSELSSMDRMLQKKGKARIELKIEVISNDDVCAIFSGSFAIKKK